MGLDMYLHKKTYVKNWERTPEKDKVQITITGNKKKVRNIDTKKVVYIEEEVAYWRKANMIHEWFIQNCAEGEDNCSKYTYVSSEDLKELYETVCKVIDGSKMVKRKIENGQTYDSKLKKWVGIMEDGEYIEDSSLAEELLPTASGFFFGSTNYDKYYIQDLVYTRDILKPIVEATEDDYGEYYYSASW